MTTLLKIKKYFRDIRLSNNQKVIVIVDEFNDLIEDYGQPFNFIISNEGEENDGDYLDKSLVPEVLEKVKKHEFIDDFREELGKVY